jgi:hypothetical protein
LLTILENLVGKYLVGRAAKPSPSVRERAEAAARKESERPSPSLRRQTEWWGRHRAVLTAGRIRRYARNTAFTRFVSALDRRGAFII